MPHSRCDPRVGAHDGQARPSLTIFGVHRPPGEASSRPNAGHGGYRKSYKLCTCFSGNDRLSGNLHPLPPEPIDACPLWPQLRRSSHSLAKQLFLSFSNNHFSHPDHKLKLSFTPIFYIFPFSLPGTVFTS